MDWLQPPTRTECPQLVESGDAEGAVRRLGADDPLATPVGEDALPTLVFGGMATSFRSGNDERQLPVAGVRRTARWTQVLG
jgi:hypothetical protein